MPASPGEVLGGSLLLLVALVPTGLALLKAVERVLRRSFQLALPERLLVAFYGAGALLYGFSSIPAPIYGGVLLTIVLGGGAAAYVLFALRERAVGVRAAATFILSPTGILLGVGFLGLLLFEIAPVWNHPFPNAWDGSVTALWMNLTLRQGTLPTSLSPFASSPVVYPLATTVWMTVPVLILGWPVVEAPVLLPPLFLSLTVPAAYSWGARWAAGSAVFRRSAGLLFAAFFGLVASWPRFYTGGSYDFAFALPLFLLAIAMLPAFVRTERVDGRALIAFGLLGGVLASLSLAAAEALLVLLVAYALVAHRRSGAKFLAWLGATAVVAAFEAAFLARSVVTWATNGQPAYTPTSEYGALNLRLVEGELDPFVPWKAKLSPFPWLSLELQLLLVLGMILVGWALLRRRSGTPQLSVSQLAADLAVGTLAMFLLTATLLLSALPGTGASDLRSVTNLDQCSILLFIFFSALCAYPLVLAAAWLEGRPAAIEEPAPPPSAPVARTAARKSRWRFAPDWKVTVGTLAVLVLVVPLASGAWATVAEGPGYIQQNVGKTSNVTAGDVAAMEWVGAHLPACSSVLVAPGSAGQFLPEYATVRVVYPMNPVPTSPAYETAVANLTSGQYSSATRSALVTLSVTDVFVTGRTSVSYPPFNASAMLDSNAFSLLFGAGDAFVLEFLPQASPAGCVAQ